jgi:hypothetical protein
MDDTMTTERTATEIDAIARVCHEANTAYCVTTGDPALPHWDELEETYRESSRSGVRLALDGVSPAAQHAGWAKERTLQGWVYGPVLDRAAKVHPCLVPYDRLPEAQQKKDALFQAIVAALAPSPFRDASRTE